MALKKFLIVAFALGVPTTMGCKEKSNTTEQTQSPAGSADTTTTGTDPNRPNPTNAQSGSAMGSAATAVGGADNPMSDAGVGGDAGAGSADASGSAGGSK